MEEKIVKRYQKPIAPRKPSEPIKPDPFRKEIKRLANLISVNEYHQTPYIAFIQNMENILKAHSVPRDKAIIELISDCDDYDYYDNRADNQVHLCQEISVPNSCYNREIKAYQKKMKTYESHLETYNMNYAVYEVRLKEYERLLPIWNKEDKEKRIAYHKKELAKLTKQ